jgi:hypothetical protein
MTDPTPNPQSEPSPSAAAPRVLEEMARAFGPALRVGLFVLALALAVYPVVFLIRNGLAGPLPAEVWWLTVLAASALAAALVNVVYDQAGRMSPGERLRVVLVVLGGLCGITTAVYGLALPFTSRYADVFGGGFVEWRKNPGALFWTALPLFGGLALAFVSLLLTSGMERTSQRARQLLYGYNAVLSALLLLFIFLLLNVLPYSGVWPFRAFARTTDWTSTGLYSLSQATKERLASINQPVKVYVMLTGADPYSNFVETLLQNCHEINPKLTWETLSRDINRRQFADLVTKYGLADPTGLIIVYGSEPNTSFHFIPRRELGSDLSTDETMRFSFKGEAALAGALTFLAEGKTKAVVYFTQGHGELDFRDRAGDRRDAGVGLAADGLTQVNYEVKPLTFDGDKPAVPDDAGVVVVARPRMQLPEKVVNALRAYAVGDAKKKGKLFILLDPIAQPDGTMAPTGLEPLLAEFGVRPGNDRLIRVDARDPEVVVGVANPDSRNPIARAFWPEGGLQVTTFTFDGARPVSAEVTNPAGPNRYTAEDLVITLPLPGQYIVVDSNLSADPQTVAAELRSNEDKLRQRLVRRPLPLAVTVSEGGSEAPPIRGHEFMRTESQPRAVVFGDATWVSNAEVGGRQGRRNRELFVSCVNWLRGRPDIGAQPVEAKTRSEYRLPDQAGTARLVLLPVALILLTVIGLGTGVWLVRRR